MGKKYTTLFVPSSGLEDEAKIWEFYFKHIISQNHLCAEIALLPSLCLPPEAKRIFARQLTLAADLVLAIKNSDYIAVYDENNTIKSITNRAEQLAFAIEMPVLFVANYDDDVFIWGEVHPDGRKTCEKNYSNTLLSEYYGDDKFSFEQRPVGGWLFEPIYPQISALESFEAKEKVFENFFKLPLSISSLELYLEEDKYQQISCNNGLALYQKV